MTVYKRKDEWDDTWRYRKWITLPNGQKKRIAGTPDINTKAAAEAAERAHVDRELNPPKPVIERRRMSDTFDRFLTVHTAEAANKPSEYAAKRSAIELHLKPAIGGYYLDEIDKEKLSTLAVKLSKTKKARRGDGVLGAKTRKNILQTLRKCLNWSYDMGWIEKVPKVTMPRVADSPFECLEDDELDALLTKAASEPLWYAAVLVAVDAGLRQGELRALKWTDISTVTGKVTVQRSRWRNIDGPPKSGKPRSLSLTQRALKALHATRETKLRGPYVFSRAKDGGAFGAEYMNETIDRLTRTAGLNKSGWHTLRHTFCTRLAMKGVPPKTIQELAGHASLATTMRYMHVVKGAADAAIALLDGPGTEWARKAASGAEE